jgi:hypothetical protein
MNKPMIGMVLGGVLGVFDGLTAWFTPEARSGLAGIVAGSTLKGILVGAIAGFAARKLHSVPGGIALGLLTGAFFAFLIAHMQGKYYFEIMLPGSLVGAIVGFATQKYPLPR